MAAPRPTSSKRYTPPAPRRRATDRTAAADAPAAAAPPPRAPVGRRLLAALVDLVLVPVVVLVLAEAAWRTGMLRLLGVSAAGWAAWSWSFGRVAWTVAAAALAYHALCIARWGRTAGKWLTGLRVEMPAGGPVGPARALWRGVWAAAVYLPWVVAPALLVGGWLTVVAGDRRSPADRAAGTRVVLA